MNKIIGISGVAGSGKDMFFSLLSKRLNAQRMALADELKWEIRDFSMSLYGIDPVNCSGWEKEKIRNLLIFHGGFRREQTSGRYWLEKLDKQIEKIEENKVICITDIRYVEYAKDEVHWLKKEKGGVLVHISRVLEDGTIKQAPNDHEKKNDPILNYLADYRIAWPTTKDHSQLESYINNFINWLDKN